jgi:hypothetical protein
VDGNINVTSTVALGYECRYFESLFNNGPLKGSLYCKTQTNSINISHITPTPIFPSQRARFDKSEMIGIGFGVVICGLAISTLVACWIIKWQRW